MNVMAIIPARANSKGLPHKNFRLLLGKPVICYTIEAALESKAVNRVVVTTDEMLMRDICADYSIDMVERPPELSQDTSRIDDALRHCCAEISLLDNYLPDIIVMLYANVPVREQGIIDKAVQHLMTTGADSVQTVEPIGKYHPYWLQKLDGDCMSKYIDNSIHRRQDLPALFGLNGCLSVITYASLLIGEKSDDPHAFLGSDRRAIVQQPHETVDIDSLRDLFIAEAAMREKEAGQKEKQTQATTTPWPIAIPGSAKGANT